MTKTCTNDASVATLVHAFVTSRVDYCNCLLAGATKASLDKLQRIMNAAARVVSDTHKFDPGLTGMRRNDLHWLDVPERVTFRLCVMVYKCLHDMASPYLSELCRQTRNIEGRRQLRSATRGDLDVSTFNIWQTGLLLRWPSSMELFI